MLNRRKNENDCQHAHEPEKKENVHACDLCDFTSTWKNGLEAHIGRLQTIIDVSSLDEETKETEKFAILWRSV